MLPQIQQRDIQSTGVISSSMFGIGQDALAHIFGILRNSLYADKPLALLREYWTNARDAHVDAFIGDFPVDVALPTDIEPTLVIRDYGFGLSETAIRTVYAMYGASTKRESNDAIGFMGIGSKSAFAYADLFTITSFHMGVRKVYNALLDASNIGQVDKVWEEPCGPETGIEIRIPVLPRDVPAFQRAATYLFTYATPSPNINIPITPKEFDRRVNGFVARHDSDDVLPGKWVAVMGSVPYNLDFSKMVDEMKSAGLEAAVAAAEGGLYFDIGDVSVSASREELEYTTRTKDAVIAQLRLLLDELVGDLERVFTDPSIPSWQKRIQTREFHKSTQLHVAERYVPWHQEVVDVYSTAPLLDGDGNPLKDAKGNVITGAPKTFRLQGFPYRRDHYGQTKTLSSKLEEVASVKVAPSTRILIKDTNVKAYPLTGEDRVAVPRDGASVAAVEAELRAFLEAAGLDGIPISTLSSLRPSVVPGKPTNTKHLERRFILRQTLKTRTPYSANWDVVDHEPGKDDVFVILAHFEAQGWAGGRFYTVIERDRQIIEFLGGTFPPIFGVKTTDRHPINKTEVPGIYYDKWRDKAVTDLLAANPHLTSDIEDQQWWELFANQYPYKYMRFHEVLAGWEKHFGVSHPIPTFLRQYISAKNRFEQTKPRNQNLLSDLIGMIHVPNPAEKALQLLRQRYPLFAPARGPINFSVVQEEEAQAPWLEYIHLIDQARP